MENLDTNIDPNIPESRDKIAAWVKGLFRVECGWRHLGLLR